MREIKLKRWILGIYIGMVVLLVAMVLVWKLRAYDKVNAEIVTATGQYDTAKTTATDLGKQVFAEAKANEKLILTRAQVDYFRTRYRSLSFDFTTDGAIKATWIRWLNEYFSDFGLEARRELITAADTSGVIINTKISVEPPPQVPELVAAPASGFLKPLVGGTVTVSVTGPMDKILQFFQEINKSQILMSIGNVKLEGASPNITATTTITPYLVASGASAVLPAAAPAAPVDPDAAGAPGGAVPGGAVPGGAAGAPPATP